MSTKRTRLCLVLEKWHLTISSPLCSHYQAHKGDIHRMISTQSHPASRDDLSRNAQYSFLVRLANMKTEQQVKELE